MSTRDLGQRLHAVEFAMENGDGAACFILTGEKPVLLDAGLSETPEQDIAPALSDLGLTPGDLAGVFLSHAHHDHMNGAAHCRAKWGLAVAGLGTSRDRFETRASKWPDFAPGIELAGRGFRDSIGVVSPDTCKIDREISSGERLQFGNHEWHVLALPGHCRSQVGFFEETTGVLIAFDAFQIEGNGMGIPIIEDFDAYRASLGTITKIGPSSLICSHPFKPFGCLALNGTDVDAALTAALRATDRLAETFRDTRHSSPEASYRAFCAALHAPASDPLTALTWSSLFVVDRATPETTREITETQDQAIVKPTGGKI